MSICLFCAENRMETARHSFVPFYYSYVPFYCSCLLFFTNGEAEFLLYLQDVREGEQPLSVHIFSCAEEHNAELPL